MRSIWSRFDTSQTTVFRPGISFAAALDTAAVAALLREYGQRSALRGGNPYRARAYSRAADRLGALTEPLDRIIAEDRLGRP
jgi:hypothetical protein